MTEAGPLTRPGSRGARQPDPDTASCDRPIASENASYEMQAPKQRGDVGRRLHSNEIVIGLALGSPGHNPISPLSTDDRDIELVPDNLSSPTSLSAQKGYVHQLSTEGPALIRKGSKWRTLGGLFTRKNSILRRPKAFPFYELDRPPQQEPVSQIRPQASSETSALRRERADSAPSVKDKRGRAGTLQIVENVEASGLLRRNSSRRKGLRRKKVDQNGLLPEMHVLHSVLSARAVAEVPQTSMAQFLYAEPSLLEVQIPNVELERYSVMFRDVLQDELEEKSPFLAPTQQQGNSEQPHGADQAMSENLVGDLAQTRRDDDARSSESSRRALSFSLFPSTRPTPVRTSVNKPLPNQSPLSRSMTAPNTTLSPPRPPIHSSIFHDQDHIAMMVPNPEEKSTHKQRATYNPTTTSADSSQISVIDCAENCGHSLTETESPRTTTQTTPRDAFPIRKSSMKKLPLTQSPCHHQASDSISTTAEVSIARQISISRRQRQLLVPIVPKIVQQPMQPTLVEEQSGKVSRKSTHPTLENA